MAAHDACTLLDEDHKKVERLFQQYKAAREQPPKLVLAREICHELTVHTQIEEEIFYPAFRRACGDDLVEHAEHEHQEARELIAKIQESPDPQDKLMLELEDAVLHHVTEERQKMFPAARKAQKLDLMGLADQLEQRKAELMAGHPA